MNDALLLAVQPQPAPAVTVTLPDTTTRTVACAGRIDGERACAAAVCRNVRRRRVRRAVVADCRNTHAVSSKHCPDGATIGAAVQILIGLQDTVARVQERRTNRRKLHAV